MSKYYTTKEIAALFGCKVKSVHCSHSLNGHFKYIVPVKQSDGWLIWERDLVNKKLKEKS